MLPLVELSLEDIKKIFKPSFVQQLDRLYMCGNYGDPVVAKDTLEVYKYLRAENPGIRLDMFTNGSAKNEAWWKELAKVVDLVHFSIDGLEDTNHLYRKGTHFPTIIKNMKVFIEAGGNVVWDYIVFRHNEHQVEEAQEIAKTLGVKKFSLKKTGRFFSNSKMEGRGKQEVYNRKGELDYYIEMPVDTRFHNTALQKEQQLVAKYGSLESYLDSTPINCKVAKEKSVYISAMGRAFPCCWTANQLYPWYFPKEKSYMWELLGKLENGVSDLEVLKHGLDRVINGEFFQDVLLKSWEIKSIKEGRPKCCAKACGTEFDPFQAQFSQSEFPPANP